MNTHPERSYTEAARKALHFLLGYLGTNPQEWDEARRSMMTDEEVAAEDQGALDLRGFAQLVVDETAWNLGQRAKLHNDLNEAVSWFRQRATAERKAEVGKVTGALVELERTLQDTLDELAQAASIK